MPKKKNTKKKTKKKKITPMIRQFLDIKDKHPDKIILFRMGDFYETFFDDAKVASKILGITLTSRNKKNEDEVPLAGFPYHALNNYLDKLIKTGHKVAVCEQVEDPKKAKGIVKREIVNIITPGAIIDSNLIDKTDNNFLSVVFKQKKNSKKAGIASIDVSTSDFKFTDVYLVNLKSELARIEPSEIIVLDNEMENLVQDLGLDFNPAVTLFEDSFLDKNEALKMVKEHFNVSTTEGLGGKSNPAGIIAAGIALAYLKSLRNDNLKHISTLRSYSLDNYMLLDEISRRNLELTASIRYNNRFGTLISIIDEAKTPMGSRLLKEWMLHPLLNLKKIKHRLDVVQAFQSNIVTTFELRDVLDRIGDLSRIISKVGSLRVNPRDIVALNNYLSTAPEINELLSRYENPQIENIRDKIGDYNEIVNQLDKALIENPPTVITEGGIIKDNYNEELDSLREISKDGKSWIAKMEQDERERTKIPSLKVGYNKVFGYYLEVTKTHKDKIPDNYIRKQTLVNSERYFSPKLKEYESKVLGAEERIKNIEYELFKELREFLYEKVEVLQGYVQVLAKIDALSNLAVIAHQRNYVRPEFNDKGVVEIKESRHPVIEQLLNDEEFIPNDVHMDDKNNKIALITGPNMAGKSTYLRQVGLLAIMAQMGGFIPADQANLPVFDKVFTRVGASDNLARGQSTFLVEMIETANILNSATENSLILLDEIGRGTSTFDGLSLAWSIVEYIHNNKKISAKTLFATHYHELTELEDILHGVQNFNIAVKEWNDKMIFLRKIEKGSADQSYGIQVARLAGIPEKVIKRAKKVLKNLEEHELNPQGLRATSRKENMEENPQLDIFDVLTKVNDRKEKVIKDLEKIDINNTTPLKALNLLKELQNHLK